MQKTDDTAKGKTVQRRLKSSTTLNRKYVKRPVRVATATGGVKMSSSIQHFNNKPARSAVTIKVTEDSSMIEQPQQHPLQVSAIKTMQYASSQQDSIKNASASKMSARDIKNQAIQQALNSAYEDKQDNMKMQKKQRIGKTHFSWGRVALALACAGVVALTIVYFVNLNMPDFSLRVAAMQTGINASYPGHVPRGYVVASITSEHKKIVLDFKNTETNETFKLTEETSSWDSNALLNNYVKETYGEDYKVVKEQGLTIYISGSNAAWVNGGVVYKITADNNTLTNKQICTIATSL